MRAAFLVCAWIAIGVLGHAALLQVERPPSREELAQDPPLFLELARTRLGWDEPAEPARILGPIFSVGTRGLSVFLIKTAEGLILINTAMPGSGPMIETAMRKLGFDPADVRLLLAGHAHCDHVGAHAYFQERYGARVAVIREEQDLLASGGRLDFHYGDHREFDFEPVVADLVFSDGDVLKLGDVAITALLTSGHTRGSTTFVMQAVEEGRTYTVVLPSGTSINPGYRLARDPSYPGIADDYRHTLAVLERLKPDVWLDAHTETYGFEDKLARSRSDRVLAWVDPEGYRAMLRAQRDLLERTVDRERGIVSGEPTHDGGAHAIPVSTARKAVVPVDASNFARAETDRYFQDSVEQGAFGRLEHRRRMAQIDEQNVVRMNRDTLYSSGVFDLAAAPVTISMPETDGRFMSLLMISEDHYAVDVAYAPARRTYTQGDVGSRYAFVLVRTFADPRDPDDLARANALQDAITVEQASRGSFEIPAWDPVSLESARRSLTALGALGGSGERFGRREEVDPVLHLIGTAIGWGGNPRAAAMYFSVNPEKNDGTVVHRLTLEDVPVDGFWSVSVYDADGFFAENALDAYSLNDRTAVAAADGSVTIQFGGCEPGTANCLPIVPGWNYTLRLYRPRAELLDGSWRPPEAVPVP